MGCDGAEDEVTALKLQVAKTASFVRGVITVAAILFGAIQYYALRELQAIDKHDVQISKLERQVAVVEIKLDFLVEREKAALAAASFNGKSQSHR